ncbi:ABC transporter ATP-binding protein [Nocardioides ginsengisoli]|uniref:ABC transporter ATP-binding protein n=1 Tax=Nocardioides ginsengisoli TaxID=363868 RepID=A0ABW3VUY3_9ACTN
MSADRPLRVERLYRFYRAGEEETLALRGVSLQVSAGEFLAVTGPSGSGKTTLLSCVAGTDEPSGGTIWIAGHRMSHRPAAVRARLRGRHLGLVAQENNLFDHLSVIQNVRLAQRLGAADRRQVPASLDLLDQLGLGGRAGDVPARLSSGELARAGLAVALANAPDLVVADEPTGELDQATEDDVLTLLRSCADRGTAVLVSGHSDAVRRTADRVLTLADGVMQP